MANVVEDVLATDRSTDLQGNVQEYLYTLQQTVTSLHVFKESVSKQKRLLNAIHEESAVVVSALAREVSEIVEKYK